MDQFQGRDLLSISAQTKMVLFKLTLKVNHHVRLVGLLHRLEAKDYSTYYFKDLTCHVVGLQVPGNCGSWGKKPRLRLAVISHKGGSYCLGFPKV